MKVKELLDKPEKWIKGRHARDKNNEQVSLYCEEACKFCLQGAILKCYEYDNFTQYYKIMSQAVFQLYPNKTDQDCVNPLTLFNDNEDTTFEDIQKVLELADI